MTISERRLLPGLGAKLPLAWQPAAEAPDDAWPLSVACMITCECQKGGIVVLSGARVDGQWIVERFNHSFEVIEFFRLPKPSIERRVN